MLSLVPWTVATCWLKQGHLLTEALHRRRLSKAPAAFRNGSVTSGNDKDCLLSMDPNEDRSITTPSECQETEIQKHQLVNYTYKLQPVLTNSTLQNLGAFLVAQSVKNLPAMWEIWI